LAHAFLTLSFDLGSLDPEAAEAVCVEHGALAVTYTDSQDDPVLEPAPGEFRLWPATRLQALFDASLDPEALRQSLARGFGLNPQRIHARTVADRVWEREWLKDFHAMRFGERLWICPFHERVADPLAVVVNLDPGLAFGTGTHPTTALCLRWLDAHLTPGMRVIDYGCGSGVLALAAAKLGAQSVHCFDIDPQALTATRDNALANAVAERVHIHTHADSLPPEADVLLANILSEPLRELVPSFSRCVRSGGQVVLAGLMDAEAADVTAAYAPCFDVSRFGDCDGWTCLAGRRS
jgi:ribosomal protein L11 methyltransferase